MTGSSAPASFAGFVSGGQLLEQLALLGGGMIAGTQTPECFGISSDTGGRIRKRIATFETERGRAEWSEEEWRRQIGPTRDRWLDSSRTGKLQRDDVHASLLRESASRTVRRDAGRQLIM
jgi:hypothetical protein